MRLRWVLMGLQILAGIAVLMGSGCSQPPGDSFDYYGPAEWESEFRAAVKWWERRERFLEEPITVLDRTSESGPGWAAFHVEPRELVFYSGSLSATPGQRTSLMRHELGHVFGLQHHPNCLMAGGVVIPADAQLCDQH